MEGKCSNSECAAPLSCYEGSENHLECKYWIKSESVKQGSIKNIKKPIKGSTQLPWSGEALSPEDLSSISIRNSPFIIGMVGRADAGKTSYLAMLFTLLLRGGKLSGFKFSGTKTILAWDKLYHKLKVQKDKVNFPDPTPAQYLRLLHLALRDKYNNLKDVLFSDASGEVFSVWSGSRDDVNAENARWVYKNANAFMLFIDCDDLIDRKNLAKTEIVDLAQMLLHDLHDRPIIAVWSKSDKKSDVHIKISESLREELKNLFVSYDEIDISNFSSDDPDILVHKNNIGVLDWILAEVCYIDDKDFAIEFENRTKDFFLNYKGRE